MWVRQVGNAMPVSSRLYPSATCSIASAPSPSSPHRRRRRRGVSLMGQFQSIPGERNGNRSSSRWPRLRLDLGFLHGRRPSPAGEKLNAADWLRCVLSPPLPAPTAESEAEAEGKAAGSREEDEVGGEKADHLVVMVNGLYGRFVFDGSA